MQKFVTLALLGLSASGMKLDLNKKTLNAENLKTYKNKLATTVFENNGPQAILDLKDIQNLQYYAPVKVGTPAQHFEIVPDTGSSNLWLWSSACTASFCTSNPQYDNSASSTYTADGESFQIQYGSGAVTGTVSKDTVDFGNGVAKQFGFGEITQASGFDGIKMSGILGLGYKALSVDSLPIFVTESSESDKSFTFYMGDSSAESYMTIPGFDSDANTASDFTWHKVQ